MAEVFEAELAGELGFARKVAIKRMLDDAAADEGAARRFLDEARIASRLHHANIVAVTDVGLLDGLPFQVLELVDGINAQQLLGRAGGTLPLEVALAIAGEVAHALDHAHGARGAGGELLGVVHRDVKPSNILVSWAGDVKLADFGIALARDRASRTETGLAVGTLGYIAPEQRMRSEVDGRADVFALGLALHAMLTGRNPLQEIAVEMAVLAGERVPLDPGLPDDVRRLIDRAVAPSRLDRPDAGQLARAIGETLAPRLARDTRSVVRSFVEPLAARRAPAGALDALLGIEVVADAEPGEVPRYHTTALARAAPVVPAPPALAPPPPPPPPPPSPSPSPSPSPAPTPPTRRRAMRIALPVLAVLLVGLGGLAAWQLASRDRTGAPLASTSPSIDASNAADAATAPIDSAVAVIARPAAPADAAPPTHAPSRTTAPRPRTNPPPRPPHSDPPAAPTETGWLLVYGADLVGSRVVVDNGAWSGSVPNPIEVAVGTRSVAVIRRDGTRLPAQQVQITTFHSPSRPLRITW
jgi:serine/threonine protein kinase